MVQLALIDAHVRKAWMAYFRRDGHGTVSHQAFLDFVCEHFHQAAFVELHVLMGMALHEAALDTKATAGGLDGWAWNEIKALSFSWLVGLLLVLHQIEFAALWPQGLLDDYIAMVPEAEGDSTPLGQRPPCASFQLSTAVGLLSDKHISKSGGCLNRCSLLAKGFLL